MKLNFRAGQKVPISKAMYRILRKCIELSEITDGLFNPFVLPTLHKLGYKKSFVENYTSDYQEDFENRDLLAPDKLELDERFAMIPENSAIDLGGIGKGYLADMLCKSKTTSDLHGFWCSIGGDVAGFGKSSLGDWKLGIQNAHNPDERLLEFDNQKDIFHIATSGTILRKGENEKGSWHHIINPKTGKSADSDVLLATLDSQSTTEADVFASCAIILGSNKAIDWLKKRDVGSALLQLKNGDFTGYGFLYNMAMGNL